MVPDKDYYADKDGKLTDDPAQYAIQVAVAGVNLDERVAKRYGIIDSLVSVDEPSAVRRVTGRSEASVKIEKAEEDVETEPEPKAEAPKAKAPEQKPAPKAAAKKGAKKK